MRPLMLLALVCMCACEGTGNVTLDGWVDGTDDPHFGVVEGDGGPVVDHGVPDAPVVGPDGDEPAHSVVMVEDIRLYCRMPDPGAAEPTRDWMVAVQLPPVPEALADYQGIKVIPDVYLPNGVDGVSDPCWVGPVNLADPDFTVRGPGDFAVFYLPRWNNTASCDVAPPAVPYGEVYLDVNGQWVKYATSDADPPVAPICEGPDSGRYDVWR